MGGKRMKRYTDLQIDKLMDRQIDRQRNMIGLALFVINNIHREKIVKEIEIGRSGRAEKIR